MRFVKPLLSIALISCFGVASSYAQQRVPATPLITHDPYFSIWSTTDKLTDSETTHWTGKAQPLTGIARIDGKPYRFMGKRPDEVPVMEQVESTVEATRTLYRFRAAGVEIRLTFFSPVFTDDLDLFSRPVTYLIWTVHSTDGASHQVAALLDVDPVIAVNDRSQQVVTTRNQTASLDVLSVGSRDQNVLNRSGDDLRIDWGYFHLAIPRNENARTVLSSGTLRTYIEKGSLPTSDVISPPQQAGRDCPHLVAEFDFGSVSNQPQTRHLLAAYTEGYAIQYFERNLRPYWQRNNMPVEELLDLAESQYASLESRGTAFDAKLRSDLTKAGGSKYAALAVLAYRQTIAAHKLVADLNGDPMLFAKENFSNGCIATVDVLYPSAPFFLFFQPKLLEAQLLPVLEYSALPRWRFPFAPHDLGQYPLANGQVYGGGEKTEDDQMPVEESGNMLILVAALAKVQGNTTFAARYWPQLTRWAEYLKEKGLDPENQLSTDDFAGHLAHNANLSIKAIVALGAYGQLADRLGHKEQAAGYLALAREFAQKWQQLAAEGDHYRLAFDKPGTWSQKYNLVWDRLLGLNLFPAEVARKEIAFYLTKQNAYGLPLDNRRDYTKLDWVLWTATLAENRTDFEKLVAPAYKFTNESPSRVPLTDWYDTVTAKQQGFQARSVVGGLFIKMLAEPGMWEKWAKAQ